MENFPIIKRRMELMINFIKKVYKVIYDFTDKLNEDHVYAYATQSAFFIIISAFPLLLLVFSLIRYTDRKSVV